jgi:hypothetical protein
MNRKYRFPMAPIGPHGFSDAEGGSQEPRAAMRVAAQR